jgi:tight adherence protein C
MITLGTLRAAFVLFACVALAFFLYAIVSAPARPASRLGMRGLKRRRALENNPGFAQIEALTRWLATRISGLLGDDTRASLDRQITLAGDYLGLIPEEYVALCLISTVLGAAFGGLAGLLSGANVVMFMIVGGAFGAIVPYLQVSEATQDRLKSINRGLPAVIDLMALGMSAGLDFPGAVRQVVEKSSDPEDPLIEEMSRILQELQLGKTRKQVLTAFAERVESAAVNEFVSALVQAEERGNPVAEVLQIQAGVSRNRRSVRAEEAAAKAGVKMVGPLFLCFGCIMLLVGGPMFIQMMFQLD